MVAAFFSTRIVSLYYTLRAQDRFKCSTSTARVLKSLLHFLRYIGIKASSEGGGGHVEASLAREIVL